MANALSNGNINPTSTQGICFFGSAYAIIPTENEKARIYIRYMVGLLGTVIYAFQNKIETLFLVFLLAVRVSNFVFVKKWPIHITNSYVRSKY